MARVEILKPREQEGHFGLYRASAGGDQAIIIRRKVGEPTDYMHTKSRAVRRQREIFAQASQHYSHLTSTQKAWTRRQFEEVEVIHSHGPSDFKLLTGRQLFISKDIRELNVAQQQIKPVFEVCLILIDPLGDPIEGELWLRYLQDGVWLECEKEQLSPLDWLFPSVPRGKEKYHPYGESPGFYDFENPAITYLTEAQLSKYHYHQLFTLLYGYAFSTRYYRLSYKFRAYTTATAMYVHSACKHYDWSGTMRVGVQTLARVWLDYKTHYVDAAIPDPKDYYSLLAGFTLNEGTYYYIVHECPGIGSRLWNGKVRWSLIP